MIFDRFKPRKLQEPKPMWEYAQKHAENPYYDKEHRETMAIIEDILTKLDEIKLLVDEIKNEDK